MGGEMLEQWQELGEEEKETLAPSCAQRELRWGCSACRGPAWMQHLHAGLSTPRPHKPKQLPPAGFGDTSAVPAHSR